MAGHHKKQEHEEVSEAWLLPYSDLMTLLLAVFIVLFAVSKVDSTKAESIAAAFKGILLGGDSIYTQNTGEYSPINKGESQNIKPDEETTTEADNGLYFESERETTTHGMTDEEKLEAERIAQELLRKEQIRIENIGMLKDSITEFLGNSGIAENFNITEKDEMLILTLSGDVLFASGSAKLNTAEVEIARQLAEIIHNVQKKGLAFVVQVTGHTDNVPISKNSQFTSNWNLSLERAASFMSAMIEGSGLDPRSFTAIGHGELDPIAPNDTFEGRAKNRRVEIQISYDEKAMSYLENLVN